MVPGSPIDPSGAIVILDRAEAASAAWSRNLATSGYGLARVDDAQAALAQLARSRAALLICNADLPGLDIDALCAALRSEGATRSVAVLAISGVLDPLDPDRLLRSGVHSVLFRPFDGAQLQARIAHLLTAQRWQQGQVPVGGVPRLDSMSTDPDADMAQLSERLRATVAHAAAVEAALRQRKQDLRTSNTVLTILYRLAQSLNSATTEAEVLTLALDRALELPGIDAGWIQLFDDGMTFRLGATRNLPPALTGPGAFAGLCECKRRLLGGRHGYAAVMIECDRLARATGDTRGLRYHASIPLWLGSDRALGLMNLAGPGRGMVVAGELEALHSVGNQVAVALERVRLHDELAQLVRERTATLEREVEERKRVETVQARLAAIIEATPDLVATSRVDGTPMYCNPAGRRMLGIADNQPDGAMGSLAQRVAIFQHDDAVAHAIAHGTWTGEAVLRRGDGTEFPVSQVIIAHRNGGGSVAYLSTNARDITEQRHNLDALNRMAGELRDANAALVQERGLLQDRVAERTATLTAVNLELAQATFAAEQSSRAKSAFLATMSHEIRTPMNGVLGMVDVLAESGLSEYQRELVGTARESGHALLGIISDILDFSKIEAEQMTLEREPVSLHELTEGVCGTLVSMAAAKGVELALFIAPEIPEMVLGDDVRLHQVLYNLLGNAIKFSSGNPARPGKVALRVTLVDAPQDRIAFECSDNGIGMSPATVAQLFLPFKQADASTTRRFGGTGLGLPISKRLVDMMDGTIAVHSTPDLGSVFTVELPIAFAPEQPVRDLPDLEGVSCVIVDSPRIRADDLRRYLAHAGASVQQVVDSAQLLRLVEAAARSAQWVVLFAADAISDPVRRMLARAGDIRFLAIGFGRRRRSRILAPNLVTIDGDALRQAALLRAVAVAAGRASPAAYADQREARHAVGEEPPTVAQAREQGRLILVAEDDKVNQVVIQRQLALLGYAAEIADDGEQALEMWSQGSYGMVLSDLHMPQMDGLALTRCIREREQGGRRVPIVILSANALRGEAMRSRSQGVDDYLTKPAPLALLKQTLETWLPRLRTPAPAQHAPAPAIVPAPTQAVDVEVLRQLVGPDEAVIRELLQEYLNGARLQAANLRAAVANAQPQSVGAIAHKLKSSSRSVGAQALAERCAQLEVAGKAGELATVTQAMRAFEDAMALVDLQVEQWLQSRK